MSWIHRETLLQTSFGGCLNAESLSIGDILINAEGKYVTIKSIKRSYVNVFKVKQSKGDDFWISNQGTLSLMAYHKDKSIQIDMFNPHSFMRKEDLDVSDMKEYKDGLFTWKLNGIQYTRRPIELNPYYFGLWLGDGASSQTKIYNIDQEVIDWLEGYANTLHMPYVYNKKRILQIGSFAKSMKLIFWVQSKYWF